MTAQKLKDLAGYHMPLLALAELQFVQQATTAASVSSSWCDRLDHKIQVSSNPSAAESEAGRISPPGRWQKEMRALYCSVDCPIYVTGLCKDRPRGRTACWTEPSAMVRCSACCGSSCARVVKKAVRTQRGSSQHGL